MTNRADMRDRCLWLGLLALFALAAGLHVKEIGRTGLALPPVFAVLEAGGDGRPVVGGLRLERSATWNGLEVGDRLLSVGDVDLHGVSYARFDAVVLAEAGTRASVPVIYERDGERKQLDLVLQPYARPWSRLPLMTALVLLAVVVWLRSPGTRQGRYFFASLTLIAAAELPFYGGPRIQTYAYVALFNVGLPLGIWLWLRWLVAFPDGVPDEKRLSPAISWIVLVFPLARLSYHLGGPVPSHAVPGLVLASDALLGATSVAVATWNYMHADPVGRRQVKWVVFGGYIGCLPLLTVALFTFFAPDTATRFDFHELFPLVMIAPLAIVMGMLIGIGRYNLFDIDRIVSATAAYSISIGASLGLILGAVPIAASRIAETAHLEEGGVRFAITVCFAVAAVPLYLRVRGPIEHFFFPGRRGLERGTQQLLQDLGDCDRPELVSELVGSRIEGLFQPSYVTTVKVGRDSAETMLGPRARGVEPDGAFVRWLSSHPWTTRIDHARFPSLVIEADPHSATRTWPDPVLVIPLRDGRNLGYFLLLGPKQSADVYTRTDLVSVTAIAERASSQLRALRDHEAIEFERIRADDLRALKEAAEHAYQSRSRFLAAASHDLRQPLHALGLFSESLATSSKEGRIDIDLVQRIRRSTASLEEMFDSLLDVSRLDVGSVEAHVEAISLGPLLAQISEQLEPIAHRKQLCLKLESGNETVVSDRVLLGRIVRNLATNAVRYTEHGEVTLSSRREADDVVIEVRDTGPGIPTARQADIFDEFVQLDPGAGEGLGLGLSIVTRLARLLGHTVSLDSTPGSGSAFAVRVPVAEAAIEASSSSSEPMGIDLVGCRVLVIDDDLQILEGMGRVLRGWGCRVTLAACMDDVEESLSVADMPDVVLADLQLCAGETGVEAIAAVRRMAGAVVPAALISGESLASAPIGLRMVRKPVPPVRLRALLMELLGESRSA